MEIQVGSEQDILENLGPLKSLVGIWEGDQGIDIAPSPKGKAQTLFRERLVFEPIGPVDNEVQLLYGLRYRTTAWPLNNSVEQPFHEELGYWMWDAALGHVMRSFMVPRVVLVNAGGIVGENDRIFELTADIGSSIYGVLSNPVLDTAFQTVRYTVKIDIRPDNTFSYSEDTQLKIKGLAEIFHHTDSNTLKKVKE